MIASAQRLGDVFAEGGALPRGACLERAELKKSATVVGDIYSPRIAIEDGAFLAGNVQVHKDIPNPQTKKEDDAPATAK